MSYRVAVTGASGFIGSHIAAAWRENGAAVRGIVRSTRAGYRPDLETVVNDFSDPVRLSDALQGMDVVIHAARTSAEDTERVVRAAARAGVPRFIHISSIAVVGSAAGPVVDDATSGRPVSAYGHNKAMEELSLSEAARTSAMHTLILRCPAVIGPGMTGRPLRLARWVMKGWPIVRVGGRRSLVYVENVAAATIAAASSSGTFVIEDGLVARPAEFAVLLADALGRRPPTLVPVPDRAVRAVARIVATLGGSAVRGHAADPIDVLRDIVVDGSRFVRETGYRPPVALDAVLERTARWVETAA